MSAAGTRKRARTSKGRHPLDRNLRLRGQIFYGRVEINGREISESRRRARSPGVEDTAGSREAEMLWVILHDCLRCCVN